jgi:hypothetical protein
MMEVTNPVWFAFLLPALTMGLLIIVGNLVRSRRVDEHAAGALRAFATWWYCAAGILGLEAARAFVFILGVEAAVVYRALLYLLVRRPRRLAEAAG